MERCFEGEKIFVAINADENPFDAYFNIGTNKLHELITDKGIEVNGPLHMEPYSVQFLKCE